MSSGADHDDELPVGVVEGITTNSSPKDIAEERSPIINPHEIKKSVIKAI